MRGVRLLVQRVLIGLAVAMALAVPAVGCGVSDVTSTTLAPTTTTLAPTTTTEKPRTWEDLIDTETTMDEVKAMSRVPDLKFAVLHLDTASAAFGGERFPENMLNRVSEDLTSEYAVEQPRNRILYVSSTNRAEDPDKLEGNELNGCLVLQEDSRPGASPMFWEMYGASQSGMVIPFDIPAEEVVEEHERMIREAQVHYPSEVFAGVLQLTEKPIIIPEGEDPDDPEYVYLHTTIPLDDSIVRLDTTDVVLRVNLTPDETGTLMYTRDLAAGEFYLPDVPPGGDTTDVQDYEQHLMADMTHDQLVKLIVPGDTITFASMNWLISASSFTVVEKTDHNGVQIAYVIWNQRYAGYEEMQAVYDQVGASQ